VGKNTAKVLSGLSELYHDFQDLYLAGKRADLDEFYGSHFSVNASVKNIKKLMEEKMRGLVDQCLISLVKQKIIRLTRTYVTLSVTDIATSAGINVEKAHEYLVTMGQEGVIDAQIDGGMVTFRDVVDSKQDLGKGIAAVNKVTGVANTCRWRKSL
jgi:hypothetical protein